MKLARIESIEVKLEEMLQSSIDYVARLDWPDEEKVK